MKGIIKTYLPEKRYGFIKGDDGKDYFFHASEFRDKEHAEQLCEEGFVHFDQQATPKGYKAKNCSLLNPSDILTYIKPDEFMTTRSRHVSGWEVLEQSSWIVHGSSRDSPDAAKKETMDGAVRIGANALINFEYYKTTGSEPGTGNGTYNYTIHNFRGRAVTIAKRNSKGKHLESDFLGLNEKGEQLKARLIEDTKKSKNKRNVIWLIVSLLTFISLSTVFFNSVFYIIFFVFIGFVFGRSTDYDSWLERA
ncbi:cold-shock protein [Oceanisphaera profunda]|nr:cold shock domain-containing protein [Oceanisphaera profunda]